MGGLFCKSPETDFYFSRDQISQMLSNGVIPDLVLLPYQMHRVDGEMEAKDRNVVHVQNECHISAETVRLNPLSQLEFEFDSAAPCRIGLLLDENAMDVSRGEKQSWPIFREGTDQEFNTKSYEALSDTLAKALEGDLPCKVTMMIEKQTMPLDVHNQTILCELTELILERDEAGNFFAAVEKQQLKMGDGSLFEIKDLYGLEEAETDCVVCMTEIGNVALIPCRHVCVCDNCARLLPTPRKCPVCRTLVQADVVLGLEE